MAGNSRSGLTLGALTLIGFASVMAVHFLGSASRSLTMPVAPRAFRQEPVYAVPAPSFGSAAVSTPAATKKDAKPERINPQIARSLGEAAGKIHFEGGEDFEIRHSIAVWQPGQHLVRIVFFESAPKARDLAELLDAIQSGNLHAVAERAAYVDMHFNPASQTIDNNTLDSVRLTLMSGASTHMANAFNSIDWQGSLPTAEQQAAGVAIPKLNLRASRESFDTDDEPGRPSWQLSLSAPVIARE